MFLKLLELRESSFFAALCTSFHQEMLMACYVSAGITAVFLEQRSN